MTENTSKKIFFEYNNSYEVTICPEDKFQYFNKTNRLGKFKSWISQNVLCHFDDKTLYTMVIELSEPKKVGSCISRGPRLHLHGHFSFQKDNNTHAIRDFLLYSVPALAQYNIVDFDLCNDKQVWLQYMFKQQHLMHTKPITNFFQKKETNTESSSDEDDYYEST